MQYGAVDPELMLVLAELQAGVQEALQTRYVGMYLQGSLALGDFDRHSDVDFVVAIDGEVDDAQLTRLRDLHRRIYALPSRWAQHLEGAYLTLDALQRPVAEAPLHWFLDHGSAELERSDHDNQVIQRYVLREQGVALDGPDAVTLVPPVERTALREEMYAQLDEWMGGYLKDPTPLENGWRQPYTVLTLCRMLCTIQYATVASKKVSAEWAMDTLDERWIGLIERAWSQRPDPALKARSKATPDDSRETLAFVKHALELAASARPGALPVSPRGAGRRLTPYPRGVPTS
jgi:hypothetical protein